MTLEEIDRTSQIEGRIEDAQRDAVQDVLIELREALKDSPAHEIAGLKAAIEIIEANFPC